MPRSRYPSDEQRLKVRPHVKVHLTTRTHRIMGPVFVDPTIRGIIVGLWMVAYQAHATSTGDVVTLTNADVCWITGKERPKAAAILLARACDQVGYHVRIYPRGCVVPSWQRLVDEWSTTRTRPVHDQRTTPARPGAISVWVRNLSKKQNARYAIGGATPGTPRPSYSDTDSVSGTAEELRLPLPDGVRMLSPEKVADLIAVKPGCVVYTPADVRAWFSWIAPRMVTKGRKPSARTAANWWPTVKRTEIEEAHRWCSSGRLEEIQAEDAEQRVDLQPDATFATAVKGMMVE